MTLAPVWRTRLFAIFGSLMAIVLGVQIANDSLFWPAVCVAALGLLIFVSVNSQPLTALLLGGLVVGYIVGNRGFAQLSLAGQFPLLPAEFVLLVSGATLAVQSAWQRELPVRRDPLNVALLLWMVVGTLRLGLDVREYGLIAVRDYAMVYYAAFFFLAQHVAREPAAAQFLRSSMLFGCGALLVVHPLFSQFTDFFVKYLSIRGTPIVFFKDDLAGNFMSMGSVLFFFRFEETRRTRWLLLSLALAGLMLFTNSRSSMVGLAVGAGWLALVGRWRFTSVLVCGALCTGVALLAFAQLQNQSWRQTPLIRLYERAASIADPFGQRTYESEDAFKGDNNVFRMVWWRSAVTETLETNRWFGLGFGHDLAARFVRQYLPETDDFTARSPHNVLITVFARMGIAGLGVFLVVLALATRRTWQMLRNPDSANRAGAYWCAAWVLLACACFGVVLEGPMGAVVFWTAMGLANADSDTKPEVSAMLNPAYADEEHPASLPS